MEKDLDVIHEELLILLQKFHEICLKHGIQYSLHGGSLLGAVREKGFIPWDDDADLSVTRAEFNKLQQVLRNTDLGSEFRYVEDDRYTKFVMKREGKPPVWADIFIYDYISSNPVIRKLKLLSNYFFVLFTRSKEAQELSNLHGLYSGVKKFGMNAIVTVGNWFPMAFRLRLATNNMQWFPGDRSLIHRANDQYVGIHKTTPAYTMESYEIIPFLGIEVMITKNHHEILVSCYGSDYMTPRREKPVEMHEITLKAEQDKFSSDFEDRI
ncbi:MAG: LicD family protein [Oscillospiraceae bacterium]|nr:LicD family protein [Oscillospiraceae bacterium]